MHVREPRIQPVAISTLRPTQMTVGLREVAAKRAHWRAMHKRKADYLGTHLIPVVRGPQNRCYVIDHHHLLRALHEEGVKDIATTEVADLHTLPKQSFWVYLDMRGWLHPFDRDGKRRDYRHIPKKIADLADDPYRSLAGELRRCGGFAKETTPFNEFLWADFLRHRITRKRINADFAAAMEQALQLVKSTDADYLPGWCGASTD